MEGKKRISIHGRCCHGPRFLLTIIGRSQETEPKVVQSAVETDIVKQPYTGFYFVFLTCTCLARELYDRYWQLVFALITLALFLLLRLINRWPNPCKNAVVNHKFLKFHKCFQLLCNWVTKGQSTLQDCCVFVSNHTQNNPPIHRY